MGGSDLPQRGFDGAKIERLLAGPETEAGNDPAPAVAHGPELASGNQAGADAKLAASPDGILGATSP